MFFMPLLHDRYVEFASFRNFMGFSASHVYIFDNTLASGAWPDRGRPGSKPGLKAEVSPATSQALAGLAKG